MITPTKKILESLALICLSLALHSCTECRKIECQNGGGCSEGICECPAGYSGELCETEDKCLTNNVNCGNHGTCDDGECNCSESYFGESCQTYCLNGIYANGNCDCNQGYGGASCDSLISDNIIGL